MTATATGTADDKRAALLPHWWEKKVSGGDQILSFSLELLEHRQHRASPTSSWP